MFQNFIPSFRIIEGVMFWKFMINWKIMSWFVASRRIQCIIVRIRTSKCVQPDTDTKIAIANQECKFIVLVTNEYDIIYTIPDQSMYLLLPWVEDVLDNGFIPKRWCWPADITEHLSTGLFSNLDSCPFTPVHLRRIRTSLGIQCNHAHARWYDEHVHPT